MPLRVVVHHQQQAILVSQPTVTKTFSDLYDVIDKLVSEQVDIVNFAEMPGANKEAFLRDLDSLRGLLARLRSELMTFAAQEAAEPAHQY